MYSCIYLPKFYCYTKSGLIAIVAGTPVPPTSGAKSILLWKMPTEVSHKYSTHLLVSVKGTLCRFATA